MQSSSQSWPMEINDPVWRSSNRKAFSALDEKASAIATCPCNCGDITSPFATDTSGPCATLRLLHAGLASVVRKWLVAVLSTYAVQLEEDDSTEEVSEQIFFSLRLHLTPVPTFHSQFRVFPPCMLANVAVETCPSAGFSHSVLVWRQLPCVWQYDPPRFS